MTLLWLFETDTGILSLNEVSRKVRSLTRIPFNERINFRKILNGFEKMASREQINLTHLRVLVVRSYLLVSKVYFAKVLPCTLNVNSVIYKQTNRSPDGYL